MATIRTMPRRYRRLTEYAEVLRRTWTETAPFDHSGAFYDIQGAYAEIRCKQAPHIPMFGGGGSDAAIAASRTFRRTHSCFGASLWTDTTAFMTRVTAAAASHNRRPNFSLSTRPILAETDDQAWDRAHQILADIHRIRGDAPPPTRHNEGSKRLLAAAARQDVHDACLWTKLAEATGAAGNSTALVGAAPDTVADALAEYYKIGASSLLIRGYDPLRDAEQYGAELIPLGPGADRCD